MYYTLVPRSCGHLSSKRPKIVLRSQLLSRDSVFLGCGHLGLGQDAGLLHLGAPTAAEECPISMCVTDQQRPLVTRLEESRHSLPSPGVRTHRTGDGILP